MGVFRTKQHRKFFSPEGWTSNSTGSTGAVAIKPFQPPSTSSTFSTEEKLPSVRMSF